ncbi:glycosyltransferase [Paenirhodobacter populi]|uniref:Glycosyltransferase n=1 Tax=Paenirhodobacter populi TaxID=2306993 RepID=A0A443JFI4_9RHOB|nr:glycosyltransferase [Sinirhodobacter populi]RWR19268.1 glycosyltransferase [Sinirhodobacter populi]
MPSLSFDRGSLLSGRKRIAIFASYSGDGFLPPQVLPYLAGLKPLTQAIIVVCDNDLAPGEREKLAPYATHVITGRHGEYDFGSYKRGTAWARDNGLLETADDLILCNDSCFGPVGSFAPMFEKMEARGLDFWGATDSREFTYHLQSYWVVLSRKVFLSSAFTSFLESVKKQDNVQKVILNYELGLTKTLIEAGFKAGAMVENTLKGVHPKDPSKNNLTLFPLYTLEHGLPLVKVKALRVAHTNADGQNRVLEWLHQNAPDLYEHVISDIDIRRFEDADDVAFSLIMPTHNRAWCISKAVTAVMAQTHRRFELIIVDDGSIDDTEGLITRDFGADLETGRIRYIRLRENVGVCNARNIGIAHARNPWIGYADSDNVMRPYFLTMMANAIVEHRDRDAFYGRMIHVNGGVIIGKSFNREGLVKGNFIDLGVFVHRRSLISKFGGFDAELRRLVDWDLCIRLTRHKDPIYIPRILLDYTDEQHDDRISVCESFLKADMMIHTKHDDRPTVSTVILGYNHQQFIVEAIESALSQKGTPFHEILLADDGSNDGTARIFARYAEKYPRIIRNISRGGNFGIAENYRHCFKEAVGKFIAVLEGDDYWTDPEKNMKQSSFLMSHPEATMVFSRIELLDMGKNSYRLLPRQDGLASLLAGSDFAKNEHLNLIANFSSAMFRKKIMADLPSAVYKPRMNEITLSFYLDRIGKFGFIDEVMSVYRLNSASVWTGASQISRLEQAIEIRENALRIAKPEHRPAIQARLNEKKHQLAALLATAKNVTKVA